MYNILLLICNNRGLLSIKCTVKGLFSPRLILALLYTCEQFHTAMNSRGDRKVVKEKWYWTLGIVQFQICPLTKRGKLTKIKRGWDYFPVYIVIIFHNQLTPQILPSLLNQKFHNFVRLLLHTYVIKNKIFEELKLLMRSAFV